MTITSEALWARLAALEGAVFHTKRGLEFTYSLHGDTLVPSRTDYFLGRGEIAKALALVPFAGPGEISALVRGPSYLWAIPHDPRVRMTDW